MVHRFLIFLALASSVIAMMLFCPATALCIMSKEILMSFNNGGLDLLPDVSVVNAEGSVTYTITIKGQKKDGDNIYTADLTAEETHTRNNSKARVSYRALGKYVYDIKSYDSNGRPCRSVTTFNIQDDKTILDRPADSYAMVGMYTSKKKGVARFKLPDFAGGFPPHYTTSSSGCNSNPSESGEFLDIEFLSNLPRIPSFGTTNTDFAQSLNYYEQKATEELSGFVETTFDGKRSRGSKTFDLINGMTLPYLKASGEEVSDSMWKGTLTISWDLGAEGETTIRIVSPKPDEDQVFKSGKLVINAEANVEPEKYKKDVRWEIQDIQGSKKSINPEKGATVKIIFDKLPSDNNQFGEKTITASVNGKQDQVKIRVFFERDAKDNPEKKNPNWFYYWKQGAVSGLESFEYIPHAKNPFGEYDFVTKKLVISSKGADVMIPIHIPPIKVKRMNEKECTSKLIDIPRTKGIDTTARIVAHELAHETMLKDSGGGKNRSIDRDNDLVRDSTETGNGNPYCLSGGDPNSLSLNPKILGFSDDPNMSMNVQGMLNLTGDGELLAIVAEQGYSKIVHRDKDWAFPGSQSKKSQ